MALITDPDGDALVRSEHPGNESEVVVVGPDAQIGGLQGGCSGAQAASLHLLDDQCCAERALEIEVGGGEELDGVKTEDLTAEAGGLVEGRAGGEAPI